MSNGGQYIVQFGVNGSVFKAKTSHRSGQDIKDKAWVTLPADKVLLFDENGNSIETTEVLND